MIYDNIKELLLRHEQDIKSKPTKEARTFRVYQFFMANCIPGTRDYEIIKTAIEKAFEGKSFLYDDAELNDFIQWLYRFVE